MPQIPCCCDVCEYPVPTFCVDPLTNPDFDIRCSEESEDCCRCIVWSCVDTSDTGSGPCAASASCLSLPVLTAQVTGHTKYEFNVVKNYPWPRVYPPGTQCYPADYYCCPPPDCPEKVAEWEMNFVARMNIYPKITVKLWRLEVCVYRDMVDCGSGPQLKWIVKSKKTYRYATELLIVLEKSYNRSLTILNNCFKPHPAWTDCNIPLRTYRDDRLEGNCDTPYSYGLDNEYGEFCFERIKFYDNRPSGIISFGISDVPVNCTAETCPIEGSCYVDEVTIAFSTCTPCWCFTASASLVPDPIPIYSRCKDGGTFYTADCVNGVIDGCPIGVVRCPPQGNICCYLPRHRLPDPCEPFGGVCTCCAYFPGCCDTYQECIWDYFYPTMTSGSMGYIDENGNSVICSVFNTDLGAVFLCWDVFCIAGNGSSECVLMPAVIPIGGTCDANPQCCWPGSDCPSCPQFNAFDWGKYYAAGAVNRVEKTYTTSCTNQTVEFTIPFSGWVINLTWP